MLLCFGFNEKVNKHESQDGNIIFVALILINNDEILSEYHLLRKI